VTTNALCNRCASATPHFDAIRSWAEFKDPIRNALHELKYRKNIGLGDALSLHLDHLLESQQWEIDLVTPVPLGEKRQKQRGYNQAAHIAQPLALRLQLSYNPQILKRTRDTKSQVNLSLKERQKNLVGAFRADNQIANKRRILVIDDVTTSGSTLNTCAEALKKAGASAVFGLTVARAVLDQ
jgi:ComF family protein